MTRYLHATAAALSIIATCEVPAQTVSLSASSRTREIAAMFTKSKHVVKEKRGVRVEKYKDVSAKPVVAANPAVFSGTYRAFDSYFVLRIRVSNTGSVEGSGEDVLDADSRTARQFVLANGKVDGEFVHRNKSVPQRRQRVDRRRVHGSYFARKSAGLRRKSIRARSSDEAGAD